MLVSDCSRHPQYKDAYYSDPKDKPSANYVFGGMEFNVPSSSVKHLTPFNTQPSRQALLVRCMATEAPLGTPPMFRHSNQMRSSQAGAAADAGVGIAASQAYVMQRSQRIEGTQQVRALDIARRPVAAWVRTKGRAQVDLRCAWRDPTRTTAWARLGLPRRSFMLGHLGGNGADLPLLVQAQCRAHAPHRCTRRVITWKAAPPSLQSVKKWLRGERAAKRSDAKRKAAAAAAAANKLSHKFDSNCGRILPVGSGRVAFSQPPATSSTQASDGAERKDAAAVASSQQPAGEVDPPPATYATQTGSAETSGLPTPDTSGKTAGAACWQFCAPCRAGCDTRCSLCAYLCSPTSREA